jgi:hypothetical protein
LSEDLAPPQSLSRSAKLSVFLDRIKFKRIGRQLEHYFDAECPPLWLLGLSCGGQYLLGDPTRKMMEARCPDLRMRLREIRVYGEQGMFWP